MASQAKQTILVTDAGQRKSVPIIRALGRAGLRVVSGETARWSMGFYSKYCGARYIYPPPEQEEAFIEWLIAGAQRGLFTILFPIDERTMTPVTRHLDRLRPYLNVPVVDYAAYAQARDKSKTLTLAQTLGVPIPKTWTFTTLEAFYDQRAEIEIPCIIKPRISSGSRGLRYIRTARDLERGFLEIHEKYPYPLVQAVVPPGGATFGVELLLNRGTVIAFFMHKRLREYPLSGGPSTLRESAYDKLLIETASRLLRALKWHGVAMVEFKVDPRDQTAKLMEINPKFWGSIALPIFAGVNFPHLLYQLAVGDGRTPSAPTFPPMSDEWTPPAPTYRYPVRCRWLIPGDILHFLANPNRLRLNPSFFDFRGEYDDLLDRGDPGPLYGMFLSFASQLLTRKLWTEQVFRVTG